MAPSRTMMIMMLRITGPLELVLTTGGEVDLWGEGVTSGEPAVIRRLVEDLFLSLIEIGEESGEVTQIFSELADRSRNEFTQWVSRVTALLEPLLIITMGLIVGGVVVTMMLSVMSINDVAV